MKRPLFAFPALCLMLFACNKSRIIENPDYESNKGISYSIERITLTDTASIFDIALYNEPGFWVAVSPSIKLRGRNTGKEYPLKWMEGSAPGVMTHLDSTGYLNVRLFFESVDEPDTIIDLEEPDSHGVRGIKLFDDTKGKLRTRLSGTLDAMGASWLYVYDKSDKIYYIPVRDGRFSYDIITDEPYLMSLYIGKELREGLIDSRIEFWSEGGEINLDFPTGTSRGFVLKGGPITTEHQNYIEKEKSMYYSFLPYGNLLKRLRELKEKNLAWSPKFKTLREELRNTKVGWQRLAAYRNLNQFYSHDSLYSEEAKRLFDSLDTISELYDDTLQAIRNRFYRNELSKPSLPHLYQLYTNIKNYQADIDMSLDLFNTFYSDTLNDHPYHIYLKETSDMTAPKQGNHFINLILPDIEGKEQSLTDLIDGKVAIIRIINGAINKESDSFYVNLKELHKKYPQKDFEVVEIRIGNKKSENKDWERTRTPASVIRLFDEDNSKGIKKKYRMGKENLKTILVDQKGIIVAVNPSFEEIESHLPSLLK